MKLAFLYAGQGSQHTGMGQDLYNENEIFKDVIDRSAEVLLADEGWLTNHPGEADLRKIMFENPDDCLLQTQNTQPALAAFACGISAILNGKGIIPDAVLGLSLGEYSSLHEAGVWSDVETVKLTAFRGQAMADAAKGMGCGMSAIINLDAETIQKCCDEASDGENRAYICNYNCPGQIVIGGEKGTVESASKAAKEAGARRVLPLSVSGPFHTPYMKPAGDALQHKFEDIDFSSPKIRVLYNYTGDDQGIMSEKSSDNEHDNDGDVDFASKDADCAVDAGDCAIKKIKSLLVNQVQNPVLLEDSLRSLLSEGFDTFIEIGPGKAITGFVKKTLKNMKIDPESVRLIPIETEEELASALIELQV